MESPLLPISRIFTERLLRIPDYQRGYAWTTKEVTDYWNDLIQLEPGKSHYVGVLTLEDVPEDVIDKWEEDQWVIKARKYRPYYIVDGQQRLTTTIILVQAILELYKEKYCSDENELVLNFFSIKEVRDKYIFMSKDGGTSRSYMFGYEKDNPSYEYLKSKIFLEKTRKYGPLEETIYTRNLDNAKQLFAENLSQLSKEQVSEIFIKVTQNFVFNIYSLDKEIDTYVAFETMNNRGKVLSHLELLKNRLIYLTTKLNVEPYEEAELRCSINECWKSIYHHLGKSKETPLDDDHFLFSHFNLYFSPREEASEDDNPFPTRRVSRQAYKDVLLDDIFNQKSLHSENSVINSTYLNDYVMHLKESVEFWYDIYNPSNAKLADDVCKWLGKIHKMRAWHLFAPLILSVIRTETNVVKQVKFLKVLERVIYIERYILIRYRSFHPETINHFARHINSGDMSTDDVISEMQSSVERMLKDIRPLWINYFKSDSDFYGWEGIRYTLYEYEMSLMEKYKSERVKLVWEEFQIHEPWAEYNTVEHIYPQRPQANYWKERFKGYTPNERKRLRNSIGNLVPLSRRRNSSLSNRPFDEKVEKGFSVGCYSENEVAKLKDWTPKEIKSRTVTLLKFIDTRWKLGIATNDKDYLTYSGLDKVR
ncbi:TPA: DUF262 domain-containing protein [Vibrio campbellii]